MKQPKQLKTEDNQLPSANSKSNEGRSLAAVDNGIHFIVQKKDLSRQSQAAIAPAGTVQRVVNFEAGTEYLKPENITFKIPGIYLQQLHALDALPVEVIISSKEAEGGSASYTYHEESGKGIIHVGAMPDYPADVKESVLKKKLVALTHEIEHAKDDLSAHSELKGQVRGKAKDWYPKIISELNAHAAQSIAALQMMKSGLRPSQNDELLAMSYNHKGFEPKGHVYEKLLTYFEVYAANSETGLDKKYASSHPKEWRMAQVNEFLFLNWGLVENLIDKVQKNR